MAIIKTTFGFGNSSKTKYNPTNNLEGEIWKTISFNSNYKVSNKGRILNSTGVIIKPFIQNSGYYAIGLWKNHQKYTTTVHKLVAMHFLDYDDKYDIDHIDGNKLNNDINNLRLITHKENCSLRPNPKIYQVTEEGETINKYKSYEEAARAVHMSKARLREAIIDSEIVAVYSNYENKYLYFKRV